MGSQREVLLVLVVISSVALVVSYGDLGRSRLTAQAEHQLGAITSQAMVQAVEVVDSVVDDLLVLDSQNHVILNYLNRFEMFLRNEHNHTREALQSFYEIIDIYLDTDAAEQTSSIEVQLIALCLQRTGFDRWKRTVQMRTAQMVKTFGKKLKWFLNTLDYEERHIVELKWKHVLARGGKRKLEKFRDFVSWLAL